MAKIEVGMLVEIVDHPKFNAKSGLKYIGHRGCVTARLGRNRSGRIVFAVEGTEDCKFDGWSELALRPIHDPDAFQIFLGQCFKPVDLGVKTGEKA